MAAAEEGKTAERRYFIGGNWKCNGTKASVSALVELLNSAGAIPSNADVVVAPPALHIAHVKSALRHEIQVAIQNIWTAKGYGAYTGEISADMAKDAGVQWVLTGHSERRALLGESNDLVAAKTKTALEAGLSVIVCCGETLAQREAGQTMDVVLAQLQAVVNQLPEGSWPRVVIAYEPVWAIGTGKVATKEQAQEVHAAIREWLNKVATTEVADATRIIYGGSVTGANCGDLVKQPDIDGFLVGGASLKAEFVDIINSAA